MFINLSPMFMQALTQDEQNYASDAVSGIAGGAVYFAAVFVLCLGLGGFYYVFLRTDGSKEGKSFMNEEREAYEQMSKKKRPKKKAKRVDPD